MPLYLGFETTAQRDWDKYVETPDAPSHYKDADKIAAYIKAAKEKQEENSGTAPLTAQLTNVVLYRSADGTEELPEQLFSGKMCVDVLADLADAGTIFCFDPKLFKQAAKLFLFDAGYDLYNYSWLCKPVLAFDQASEFENGPIGCRLAPGPSFSDPTQLATGSSADVPLSLIALRFKLAPFKRTVNVADLKAQLCFALCKLILRED